jgi:hypothetical protein
MRTDVWPGNLNFNFARISWNERLDGMTDCRNQVLQVTTEMTPNDYLNIETTEATLEITPQLAKGADG